MQTLILKENLDSQIRNELKLRAMIDALLLDQIVTTNRTDPELDELRQEAIKEDSEYAMHNKILYYKNRIFVL